MDFYSLFLLALALSMDAFAVSICKGISVRKMNFKKAIVIGIYFGFFQALMPFIGFFLTDLFSKQIESFDHWVAFALLIGIGIKMLLEAFDKEKSCDINSGSVRFLVMIPLAVATSIDALAAGITLHIEKVNIYLAVLLIGVVTFILCMLGSKVGNFLGTKCQKTAEIIGGIILILIGIKILLEHLELFSL
ncbi:MAG: hypothetical protein A2Y15_05465 [Clostridiales bacterium GWF2_36_10]|nr:MAG: hypothetical protein A2Y15_05465 [Clostridiales bacterium GWF2_36_10]HAN20112.1 hypothetical protein [Clostridiales bacterium]